MRVALSNMRASRVSLFQNHYASGLPSIGAFMGLGAVVMHALGFSRHAVKVLPVLHELAPSLGRTRSEMERKNGRWNPREIPEDLHGTVTFSIILDLPDTRDNQDIRRALQGRRLAGGPIFPERAGLDFTVQAVPEDGQCFGTLRRGRLIAPLQGEPVSFGDPGTLAAVAEAYRPQRIAAEAIVDAEPREEVTEVVADAPEAQSPAWERRGYRVPLAIGYRLIGQISDPPPHAARDNTTPHTFAEPGVSVGELISIRNPRLSRASRQDLDPLFFRWSSMGEHITFHPYYNPDFKG